MAGATNDTALEGVEGFLFPVRASAGLEPRAVEIAVRIERARSFLTDLFGVEPGGGLLVLAMRDWDKYSAHPAYGMPNYAGGNIVVAGESSTFWHGFAAALERADHTDREAVLSTYAKDGEIDLAPFFDLLAVHELAHLYHEAVPFRFPALWLMELFCNLALHGYVATYEPAELPVLETFPQAFARLDASAFPHRSLDAFERLYVEVGPENYGWYQVNLHVGARRIYDSGGVDALSHMWKTFALDPERLSSILESEVDPEAARLVRDWPPAT